MGQPAQTVQKANGSIALPVLKLLLIVAALVARLIPLLRFVYM